MPGASRKISRNQLACVLVALGTISLDPTPCDAQTTSSTLEGRWEGSVPVSAEYPADAGYNLGQTLDFRLRVFRNGVARLWYRYTPDERWGRVRGNTFRVVELGPNVFLYVYDRYADLDYVMAFHAIRNDERTLLVSWWRVVNATGDFATGLWDGIASGGLASGGIGELHRVSRFDEYLDGRESDE